MKELNNIKELSAQDLENVSGGANYDAPAFPYPDVSCPFCGFKGMSNFYETKNGKVYELLVCPDCYHGFYYNEAGELVHFGRIMG